MRAMILAAGRGKRMMPLTATSPKPLLRLWDRPLIEWQILSLRKAGIHEFVINTAYLGSQIIDYLEDGSSLGVKIHYSVEGNTYEESLETLGGIARALSLLDDGKTPFIVVSADIVTAFPYKTLEKFIPEIEKRKLDAHLVMVPNPDFHQGGDMAIRDGLVTPVYKELTYANIGIFSPRIFRNVPVQRVKLFPWLHQFALKERISGELYEGPWANVGTPEDMQKLNGEPPYPELAELACSI